MTRFKDADWQGFIASAKVNHERISDEELEIQCRAIAKVIVDDEDHWEFYKDYVFAVEVGRQAAIKLRTRTPEEIESWRNYMMNR